MKDLLNSMGNVLFGGRLTADEILEKYPATFQKNDKEALRSDWIKVGNDIRGAINEFKKETSKK